ncbi:MAG TPA: phosphate acetyltransferase, partial [Epsilonproteobacteria bacterium]|nr:phosphate acetyltransferase [Campylobacterota bacterium]
MHPQSIYIASAQPRAGSLIIAIGFMEMLKGHFNRVAFFRPIIPDGTDREKDIDFMLKHFELDIAYEDCCGFTVSEYTKAYADGKEEELHEALIHKVDQLHKSYDFVLIEGYPRNIFASVFDFDINLKIARNLGTVFVPVIHGKRKSSAKIIHEIQIVSEAVSTEGCTHLATFVNRCDPKIIEDIKQNISTQQKEKQVYLLPEVKELNTPTLDQIIKLLDAKMIMGSPEQLQHLIYGNKIAAMGVENYLSHINDGDLVIVPGDRIAIIIASLLSYYGKNHPNITGMILSGGIIPSDSIMNLLKDFNEIPVPILSVESDSYQTAIALDKVTADITSENKRKITLAKGLFDAAID